ncbi:hypothetical protein [Xanthomonas phage X1]|nr:hypothetical protein [Xanthomonas phage X1]
MSNEVCVKFPAHLVQTVHDGYLYDRNSRQLFSFKSGKLKPIKQVGCYQAKKSYGEDGWAVSVSGKKKFMAKKELQSLYPTEYQVPFA